MAKVFQVDSGGTLTTNLVAYYKLDDATDFWGTNNLTNTNVTFSAGKVGNGAQFNGTTAKLTTATRWLTTTGAMSFACWANLTSTSDKGCFMQNGTNQDGWMMNVGGTTGDATGNHFVPCSDFVAWLDFGVIGSAGWHHFVFTWNGSNSWGAYLDGSALTSIANNAPNAPTTQSSIGWANQNGSNYFFDGMVDEAGIWSKVLSSTEVTDLYNGGSGQTMVNSTATKAHNLTLLGIGS